MSGSAYRLFPLASLRLVFALKALAEDVPLGPAARNVASIFMHAPLHRGVLQLALRGQRGMNIDVLDRRIWFARLAFFHLCFNRRQERCRGGLGETTADKQERDAPTTIIKHILSPLSSALEISSSALSSRRPPRPFLSLVLLISTTTSTLLFFRPSAPQEFVTHRMSICTFNRRCRVTIIVATRYSSTKFRAFSFSSPSVLPRVPAGFWASGKLNWKEVICSP